MDDVEKNEIGKTMFSFTLVITVLLRQRAACATHVKMTASTVKAEEQLVKETVLHP